MPGSKLKKPLIGQVTLNLLCLSGMEKPGFPWDRHLEGFDPAGDISL